MVFSGALTTSDCFRVVKPRGRECAVVVEAPHAGLRLDAETLSTIVAPARSIAKDADLFVDELVDEVTLEGATLLAAQTSRYLVDLNRSADDHDSAAVDGSPGRDAPHGVVWHRTTDGDRALRYPLQRAELERRLDLVYRPYHATLRALLDEKKERFGHVVLLCAHSMPSYGVGLGGREVARADIVPGTRGRTTAAEGLIELVDKHTRASGLSLRHDDPYRGGFSTAHYGVPSRGVHAIQIEVARRLYMNETTLVRTTLGVKRMQRYFRDLVALLGAAPGPTRP